MNLALLLKELRGLKTFAALFVGIEVLFTGYVLTTHFPDEKSLSPSEVLNAGHGIPIMLFGLMLGAALLMRESDEGTLHFLDGLPISRTQIFAAKLAAGLLVLALVPLFDFGGDIFFGVLSQTSVSAPFPWRFALSFFALNLLACGYVLASAMAISFLRQWFALTVGTLLLGFLWLQARGVTWIDLLNPTTLQPAFTDGAVHLPWRQIAVQTGAAVAALGFAWAAFQVLGARSRDTLDRAGGFGRFIVILGKLCTPAVWIGALVLLIRAIDQTPDAAAGNGRPAGETAFASQETRHYDFLFRESQRAEAAPLFYRADEDFRAVANFFGTADQADRIVVDLASSVVPHAGGQTNWTKIRIPLAPEEKDADFRRILGHETAHVLMQQLGGVAFLNSYNATRFFDEGMATVVEEKFFSTPEEIRGRHRLAAAVLSRGAIPFHLLCDNEALAKARDPEVVYPLGSAFDRALIQICGPTAPARVVAEFRHPRFGPASKGETVWRDVLQTCGFNFDTVIAAYAGELSRLEKEEAQFVQTLPRLSASISIDGDEVVLHPHFDGAAPGRIVCCIEHPVYLGDSRRWVHADEAGTIRFPRVEVTGATVRYLLGWSHPDLPWPVFEPWVEAPL